MTSDVLESLIHSHLPAAANGDQAAYGRIVAACQNTISAIALAIVRDVHASEDIAQEAFLSAWQNLRKLNNSSSFLPWLRQITRNLARDHLRSRAYRANPPGDVDAIIAAVADPGPCPAEQLGDDQEQRIAAEVIDALPEESREVLLLYYREGQSSRQVAALLGLQDAAVRKRLSRARQSIREELLARLGEFARRTTPGAAFTAVVLTTLTTASPPAAAASILGVGAVVGGKSVLKIVIGSSGALAIGLLATFAGIFFGLKKELRGAIDDLERQQLTRNALINAVIVVLFFIGMIAIAAYDKGWIMPSLLFLAFSTSIGYQNWVARPHILARRHAAEAARDPVKAARERRKERWRCWLGAVIGYGCGIGGMIYGLIHSGRLGF